ncbi:MAG: hypothetical protein F4X56_00860 [Gammaproteobacteria bacterium]|nr:hypothetical protein [Gammaproteobacteria bacterium]
MKKILVLPFLLLTVCVFAQDRVILGTFEQETAESENFLLSSESSQSGYGLRFYNFKEWGFYYGGSLAQLSGERDLCAPVSCVTVDISATTFSAEIGMDFGEWTPFAGASFSSAKDELSGFSYSDDAWSFSAGVWFKFDKFKIRGAMTNIDNSDNQTIIGGFLYQMDNNYVLGAEVGMLLNENVDGFKFSLQFGRAF